MPLPAICTFVGAAPALEVELGAEVPLDVLAVAEPVADTEDELDPPDTNAEAFRVPHWSLMLVVQLSWPALFPTFWVMQSWKAWLQMNCLRNTLVHGTLGRGTPSSQGGRGWVASLPWAWSARSTAGRAQSHSGKYT